ncbi:hypothetical protein MTR67_023678 [Solanum verrucosum]|uniref:Uncharacterized protein n=1 Tax=Solanum verrucosum TaxID=315347 RepID=A0AAF0TYQ3_SOLVR|nr:hypothetical protein MTR67_023678 [Solanum verrucosum]
MSRDMIMVDPVRVDATRGWVRTTSSTKWSDECVASFLKLKSLFTLALILTLHVEGHGFTVLCDAFGVDVGCVL